MRRREFIAGLGTTAAGIARGQAQQPVMPVIGFLSGRSRDDASEDTAAFRQGLGEMGYVDAQNVAIEYRWSEGRNELLAGFAAELARRPVAVIAAVGGNNSAFAAKAATASIPIVFTSAADPVNVGLVASLNRPGGNVTGVAWFASELGPKLLAVLGELVPNITLAAVMVNPESPETAGQVESSQQAARALGWQLLVHAASSVREIDAAFAEMKRQRVNAIMIGTDPFYRTRLKQIVAQASHHAIPTIYFARDFVTEGGLVSYGNSIQDAYRRAGLQTGRLLKGAQANDLPVDRAVKFELVINLKTAKALNLVVPPMLLARADEVIE